MGEKSRIPKFVMTRAALPSVQMIIDYVADYMANIYSLIDEVRQKQLLNAQMAYLEQLQVIQLKFNEQVVEAQRKFLNEARGLLG